MEDEVPEYIKIARKYSHRTCDAREAEIAAWELALDEKEKAHLGEHEGSLSRVAIRQLRARFDSLASLNAKLRVAFNGPTPTPPEELEALGAENMHEYGNMRALAKEFSIDNMS